MNVSDAGLSPSPLCYFLSDHYDLTGSVLVTASHNPSDHNGFKVYLNQSMDFKNILSEVRSSLLKNQSSSFPESGREIELDTYSPYISSLKKEFLDLPKIPFVVDAGHGASGPLLKKVFKDLELKPHLLFCEPDGKFPSHSPDPTVEENLTLLKEKVKETNSAFGFALDGDGDRIGAVSSSGRFLYGDEFGFLFLKSLLNSSLRNSPLILGDVKCSDWFFKEIQNFKGKPLMVASGHNLVRNQMREKSPLMALDFSGHIFFNDRSGRGYDDGLYAGSSSA